MRNETARQAEGAALIALSALIWSGAGLFMRALEPVDLPAIQFWRAVFGALSLYLVVWWLRGREAGAALRLDAPRLGAAILCAAASLAYIAALRLTSVAEVMIVAATMPILAAFVVWLWLGERPDRATLLTSLLALLGVVVMAGGAAPQNLLGDAVAFLMALLFAVQLAMTRVRPEIDMASANAHGAVLIALATLPFAGRGAFGLAPYEFSLLFAFGVSTTGLATALLFKGAGLTSPAAAALILLLDNVLSPVWVWLVFGEDPGSKTYLGGAVVLCAVLLHLLWRARPRAGSVR
jgi:drug/metabolite transporter (DMT)-like permease